MPRDVSPASYIPGARLARGSAVSEPVIPAGSGGADSGANGFWLAGLVSGVLMTSGDGEGEGVCAGVLLAKHDHKKMEATNSRKAMVCTRFMSSPLKVFPKHGLHNPDLSALAAVNIGREIE